MYYVYSVILFLAFGALSFLLNYLGVDGDENIFYAIGWIIVVISVVVTGVGFIGNLHTIDDQKRRFEELREELRDKKAAVQLLEKYKEELKNALTTLYPDYEKEVYKIMAKSDAESLSTLFAQYPELKYNAILEQYTDKITECLNNINRCDRSINTKLGQIKYCNVSSWVMYPPDIPQWIEDLDVSLTTDEEKPSV